MAGSCKPRFQRLVLATILVIAASGLSASVDARVWRVPDDEPRLDGALALASMRDTVLVAPGEYQGPFVLPPGVRLEAESGPAATILTVADSLIVVTARGGGPGTALVGFTVRGGGMGLDLQDCEIEILDCRVMLNQRQGIRCGAGTGAWIRSSEIEGNGYGVVVTAGSRVYLGGNRIRRNREGIYIAGGEAQVFRNLILENRYGLTILEGASVVVGGSLRDGNDFRGNTTAAIRHRGVDPLEAGFNFWGSTDCRLVRRELEGPVRFLPLTDEDHREVIETCP